MEEKVFILHGYWNTPDHDGVAIIKVSHSIEPVEKMLDEIAESHAKDYIEMYGYLQEDHGERYYEVVNCSGKYAKFYITEEAVEK